MTSSGPLRAIAPALAFALVACTAPPPEASRDEARRTGGAADMGRDLCEEFGWYGDGSWCDEFCPSPDPDCSGACLSHDDCPPIFCEGEGCPETRCMMGNCAVASECVARLSWLQKDAYASRAGRSHSFWPPHTTMVLTVSCDGSTIRESVAANHGTQPDAMDEHGNLILEEVWSDEVRGTRAQLENLAAAFEGCECGTTFLSLEALDANLIGELVGELTSYVGANLDCPESIGGTGAMVQALSEQNLPFVLANGPDCAWSSGASWEDGFNDALGAVTEATSETLADFHVCNNDARLQADLFERFRSGDTNLCDAGSSICSGPEWFYDPTR